MKTYSITISRFDENDNVAVLVDRYISADAAIDLMLYVQGIKEVETVPAVEPVIEGYNSPFTGPIENIKDVPYTNKKIGKPLAEPKDENKVYKCGKCGGHGHNARKCTARQFPVKVAVSIPDTPKPQPLVKNEPGKDYRSLTAKVRELFDQGLDFVEVCNELQEHEMVEIKAIYDDFEARLKHKQV